MSTEKKLRIIEVIFQSCSFCRNHRDGKKKYRRELRLSDDETVYTFLTANHPFSVKVDESTARSILDTKDFFDAFTAWEVRRQEKEERKWLNKRGF